VDIDSLKTDLLRSAGLRLADSRPTPVGGGSINRAYRIRTDRGHVFLKLNRPSALPLFEAEALGLSALGASDGPRVPRVLGLGATADLAYLALEWIELSSRTCAAETALGRALARQHRATATSFGWTRDNAIGSTPQLNTPDADWHAFFRDRRLRFQLELAVTNGLPRTLRLHIERIMEAPDFLGEHEPVPSLLHGDLWGGNWGATAEGEPVIFDPAVYFGDREADLAMTRLFGGFGDGFYAAYEAEWPLDPGWAERVDVYNLYHLLNHFNLFGGTYLGAVESAVRRIEAAFGAARDR